MKKAAFYTLGCKVNQYETDAMEGLLRKANYEIVGFNEVADIYIINTCTVTAHGDKKSRHIIYKAKRTNPNAKIVVTGCLAQISKDENKTIEGADILIGTEERKNIVSILEDGIVQKLDDIQKETEFWECEDTLSNERTRAYVKIEDGCDRYCTYCIIPYVRGRVRSREKENIIKEVIRLVERGFSEIVLIGIHLASYGKDLEDTNLVDIIEKISKISGVKRIRLGSLEPNFINEDNVKRLKEISKLCAHFHLSLQSGCDETLKRMNRKYSTQEFAEKVELLRKKFEDVSITTDIIVGFPGETDEEFNSTYEFLSEVKLSKMHIFPYSKREGTPAASMPGQVDEKIKNIRAEKLMKLSEKNEEEFKKLFLGKEMMVILERREKNGFRLGYNEQYVSVAVKNGNQGDYIEVIGNEENLGLL